MFKKAFKIKSNTQLKASDRKSFKDLLQKSFPTFTEDQLNELLHKKEVIHVLKLVTHNESIVLVYTVQKRPMAFDLNGQIYPTVYLLWKYPNIVYNFTTHSNVMSNISAGADLMLPGVVTPPISSGLSKYGQLAENSVVAVNLTNNKAPIAVGLTNQSSSTMMKSDDRGKCVIIHHYFGDKLCSLEGLKPLPLPNCGPPDWLLLKSYEQDFPQLGSKKPEPETSPETVAESSNGVQEEPSEVPAEEAEEEQEEDNMDDLLYYSFMTVIKYSKTLTLPCLTSNFYKLQILEACPSDKSLDLKKTSYKKLKPFLTKMSELGLITVKEIKKGVEAITVINRENPKFAEFYVKPEDRPRSNDNDVPSTSTSITESFMITPLVLPLFAKDGFQRNDTIRGVDVRKFVTKYVKETNCQHPENPKLIKPDELLKKICKTECPITWEEVIEKIKNAMKNCYQVSIGNENIVNKGNLPPITLNVSVRSGNKKVTLIDNLELYGINLNEFAKECQHGVAASTSISTPPGKKSDQLLVQGNQINFVYSLLTGEKYKIPKKYIRGLENAPKKKK